MCVSMEREGKFQRILRLTDKLLAEYQSREFETGRKVEDDLGETGDQVSEDTD